MTNWLDFVGRCLREIFDWLWCADWRRQSTLIAIIVLAVTIAVMVAYGYHELYPVVIICIVFLLYQIFFDPRR